MSTETDDLDKMAVGDFVFEEDPGFLFRKDVVFAKLNQAAFGDDRFQLLYEILRRIWCGDDKERETDTRIGSMEAKIDSEGHVRFEFVSRFSLTNYPGLIEEIQTAFRQMDDEAREEFARRLRNVTKK